jgi:hypothetical protein
MRRAHFRFRHVGTQTQMPAHILRPLHKGVTNVDRKHDAEKPSSVISSAAQVNNVA